MASGLTEQDPHVPTGSPTGVIRLGRRASLLRSMPHARRLPALLRALRPLQWAKNAILLAALVFDHKLFQAESVGRTLLAVIVFCAASSAVYLVNDVRDAPADRNHPTKRRRPIAAGEITAGRALTAAAVLAVTAGVLGWIVRPEFVLVVVGYVSLMVAYSLGLKRLAILDVFAIAAGFVLRAVAGAVAIAVAISPWLLVCTMLLALFIGFAKRRHELASLEDAVGHRANLGDYSLPLLDQLIGVTASATVMAYSFYTFDAAAVPDNHAMMLTVPFVVYAIFRYLFLVHRRDLGGSPEVLLFSDVPLLAAILSWGFASILILYLAT